MAISNFHTHTYLCGHAEGMAKDYILSAKEQGCTELGMSDHCPYPETMAEGWSETRMKVNQIAEYKESILEGAKEVPFKVHFGFECEFDKNYKSWYAEKLKGEFGADYLVLGPHWITVGKEHIYVRDEGISKELMFRYAEQTIEAVQSGIFAFVAHPDLFMATWHEWDDTAKSVLSAILDACIDENLPLEINGLGILRGTIETKNGARYGYPYLEFWQMAKDKGAKVICNSDAHNPNQVITAAQKARDFASSLGLVPIDTIF